MNFNIFRQFGEFGSVAVSFAVSWTSADRTQTSILPCTTCSVTVPAGSSSLAAAFTLDSTTPVRLGDQLTVTLSDTSLLDPLQGSIIPYIDASIASVSTTASLATCDSVLTVAPNSLSLTVAKGASGSMSLQRLSTRGALVVFWSASQPFFSVTQGNATFLPGASNASIAFTVLQDNVSELAKAASISIVAWTPTGTQVAGEGILASTIQIPDSNIPFGSFAISSATFALQNATLVFPEGSQVPITVVRSKGAVGPATVFVVINSINASAADFTIVTSVTFSQFNSNTYRLFFADGQVAATFYIGITSDQTPKLLSAIQITLQKVTTQYPSAQSVPTLGSNTSISVYIAPSNNPYGRFGWSLASLSTSVGGTYNISIARLDGTYGSGSVHWTAVPANGIISTLVNGQLFRIPAIADMVDISPVSGDVFFDAGQTVASFQILIKDNGIAEPLRQFTLSLSSTSTGAPIEPTQSNLSISVLPAHNPNGVFYLNGTNFVSSVAAGSASLGIFRSAGLFGNATVTWSLVAISGSTNIFPKTSGSVQFSPGQSFAALRVAIVPNNAYEDVRTYQIAMNVTVGGAMISYPSSAVLTVAKDAGANGAFGFTCSDQFQHIVIGNSSNSVNLTIIRNGGAIGTTTVQVSTTSMGTAQSGVDFVPLTQTVSFAPGQTSQWVIIQTNALSAPLTTKTIFVELSSPTGGAALTDANSSTITVCDSATTVTILSAAAVAVCSAASYVSPPAPSLTSASTRQIQQATIVQIAASIEQLLELNSGATNATTISMRNQAIKDLFAQAAFAPALTTVTSFLNLPLLMERFAQALLNLDTTCPGSANVAVNGITTVAYQRVVSLQNLNGVQLTFDASAVRLPPRSFSGNTQTCPGVAAVSYASDLWFPTNSAYYEYNTRTQQPTPVSDPLIEVLQHQVVALVPPASLEPSSISYSNPVVFSVAFGANSAKQVVDGVRRCAWWDSTLSGGSGAWSTQGCQETSQAPSSVVTCQCNHATNFAVLVHRDAYRSLSAATKTGLIFLLVCVLVAFILPFVFGKERNTVHSMLLHFFITLSLTLLIVVINVFTSNTISSQHCSAEALILHYFLLAHSAWFALTFWHARDIIVLGKDSFGAWKLKYLLLGYGAPIVVIALYIAIYTPTHSNVFSHTYGFVTEHREFCMMPSFNINGLIGALMAPYLSSIPLAVYVLIVCKRRRRVDWNKPSLLYNERTGFDELVVQMGLFTGVVLVWMFVAADILIINSVFRWFILGICIALGVYILRYYAVLPKLAPRVRQPAVPASSASAEPVTEQTHRIHIEEGPLTSFTANSIKVVSTKPAHNNTAAMFVDNVSETEYETAAPVLSGSHVDAFAYTAHAAEDDDFDAIRRVLGTSMAQQDDEPEDVDAKPVNRNSSRRISISDTHL